jgi:hypothetical protein
MCHLKGDVDSDRLVGIRLTNSLTLRQKDCDH